MIIIRNYFCTVATMFYLSLWTDRIDIWIFGISLSLTVDLIFTSKAVDAKFFSADWDLALPAKPKYKYRNILLFHVAFIFIGAAVPFVSHWSNGNGLGKYVPVCLFVFAVFPFSIFGLGLYFNKEKSAADLIRNVGSVPVEFFAVEAVKSKKISNAIYSLVGIVIGCGFLVPLIYSIKFGFSDLSPIYAVASFMMSLAFSVGLMMILLSMLRLGRTDLVQ